MIKISKELIKEIASELECGMICYYNKNTQEIKTVLDFNGSALADMEFWEDIIQEVENNEKDYIQFVPMDSRESYEVMEDFIVTVDEENLRRELINALEKKKPFQNFKSIIDNSGVYRQKWFDFKTQQYIKYVEDQLDHSVIKILPL
jgi:hypothetical protein